MAIRLIENYINNVVNKMKINVTEQTSTFALSFK